MSRLPACTRLGVFALSVAGSVCSAQNPAPLPTPSITGPLQQQPPVIFDAGPLGKLDVNAIVTGMGLVQSDHASGDDAARGALSNGQIFIQKTDGWWQFYVQAGAYNILALGTPFASTENNVTDLYGPVPVAYLKLAPGKSTSIEIGQLPTLIGAEYTFSFENMNVNRGLLWNQENAVSRGIQLNQTMGKFTASLSWNDGFYSDRYTWLTGSLTYANGPHSLAFTAGGNYSSTGFRTFATPVQNNGSIYDLIYTYTKAPWIVQPYIQYNNIPRDVAVGILNGASTWGGAFLVSRAFKHGFSLPARIEYITSSGGAEGNAVNLLYGPGSNAFSLTLTPTWQSRGFFARADIAWVHAADVTPGDAFGTAGNTRNQVRGVVELGFIFGDNVEKKP